MGVIRRVRCPTCQDLGRDRRGDNLAIYADGHGFCFSCGAYFPAYNTSSVRPDAATPGQKGWVKVAEGLISPGEYLPLIKRGITQKTCEFYGYTISEYRGQKVQVAPYYDNKGTLVAQHLRGPNKQFWWLGDFSKATLFGQQLFRDGGKMVVVTEGEIDCLSVAQQWGCKYPVVSVPNGAQAARKAIAQNSDWLERFERVVLLFDNDEVGIAAAKEAATVLTPGKAYIARTPLKDANEMLKAGRGAELIDIVWGAKVFRPDGILNGAELWEVLKTAPTPGLSLPYPKLQDMTAGIRKGELWLFTAGSGVGKSTMVNEIGYHLFKAHDQTVGVIALEESVKRAAERYVSMELNKPVHLTREGVSEEDLQEAFSRVLGSGKFWFYDHFGSSEVDNILAKIRYMIVGLGVDFLILDHISIVVSGLEETEESERKTIDRLMTNLRKLVQETGAGILAVVHLKRPDKGKGYNEGRPVSLVDLRGSAALEQLSDVVIALERDQQGDAPNVSQVRVLKNRPVGLTGLADTLLYNPKYGRLLAETVVDVLAGVEADEVAVEF